MAVMSITGSQFIVKVGTTAYSEQVTDGTVTHTPTISRTKTLGGVAYPITDQVWTVKISYLYDEEAGFHGALNTGAIAGTGLTVEIDSADAKWTGTMYVTSTEVKFAADGVATGTAELIGSLTLADLP